MTKRKKLRTSGIWTVELTRLFIAASGYRKNMGLCDHPKLLGGR